MVKSGVQKTALIIFCAIAFTFILIWGKQIFMPLAFSLLLTFLLHPICNYFERRMSTEISIILIFVIITAVIAGIFYFFVDQFISIASGLQKLSSDITNIYDTSLQWLSEKMNISEAEGEELIKEKASDVAQSPIKMVGTGVLESTYILMNFVFVALYTFFFLLYRRAFKNFIISRFPKEDKREVELVIKKVQRMIINYLGGLMIVIGIMAVLNSAGLLIIGVENAIFWGIFAAMMVIIPYIGTFIGAILPILHVTITGDSWWQPVSVAILFIVVQFLEGNIITPKIVGSSVKLNPLAAIIGVVFGGMVWGIAGSILAMPFLALARILFNHIDGLKDLGNLLDSDIYKREKIYLKKK